MSGVEGDELARGSLPDLDAVIRAPRGNMCCLRRPGNRKHAGGMPLIERDPITCSRFPDLRRLIRAPRDDHAAAAGPAHAKYAVQQPAVAAIGIQGITIRCVPY